VSPLRGQPSDRTTPETLSCTDPHSLYGAAYSLPVKLPVAQLNRKLHGVIRNVVSSGCVPNKINL
jgi:hypothetical protein